MLDVYYNQGKNIAISISFAYNMPSKISDFNIKAIKNGIVIIGKTIVENIWNFVSFSCFIILLVATAVMAVTNE